MSPEHKGASQHAENRSNASVYVNPESIRGSVVDATDVPEQVIDYSSGKFRTIRSVSSRTAKRLHRLHRVIVNAILIAALVVSGIYMIARQGKEAAKAVRELIETIWPPTRNEESHRPTAEEEGRSSGLVNDKEQD